MGKYDIGTALIYWSDEDFTSLLRLIIRKLKEHKVYNQNFKNFYKGIDSFKKHLLKKCGHDVIARNPLSLFWDTFQKSFKNEALASILTIDIMNDPGFIDFFNDEEAILNEVERFTKKEIIFALGAPENCFYKLSLESGKVLRNFVHKYDKDVHYDGKGKLRYVPGLIGKNEFV